MNLLKNFIKKYVFVVYTFLLILLFVIIYIVYSHSKSNVTYYFRDQTEIIGSIKETGINLPDNLIIEPGNYIINDRTYKMEKEGLYMYKDRQYKRNIIIYKQDPWAILSGLSWLEGPDGENFKKLKPSQTQEKAINNLVSLSCGNISSFATIILQSKNIETRSVMGLNPGYDWNDDVDNGHTILEVKIDNRWVLVDLDNNIEFRKKDKNLTYWEFFQIIQNKQEYEIKILANDRNSRNENEIRDYYQQMFQVPFIFDGKLFFFTAEGEAKEKAQNYSHRYRFLEKNKWLDKFYPDYGYI